MQCHWLEKVFTFATKAYCHQNVFTAKSAKKDFFWKKKNMNEIKKGKIHQSERNKWNFIFDVCAFDSFMSQKPNWLFGGNSNCSRYYFRVNWFCSRRLCSIHQKGAQIICLCNDSSFIAFHFTFISPKFQSHKKWPESLGSSDSCRYRYWTLKNGWVRSISTLLLLLHF